MIKNNAQLKKARERLNSIREQLQKYRSGNGDANGKFLIPALQTELEQIIGQITEYQNLTRIPFEAAVEGLLNKHMLIDNIGELLSKLRIAAKLSQAEMAEKLGWEQSNLSRFEGENYSSQTINKIVEYVSALGVWLHVVPSFDDSIDMNIEKEIEINLARKISVLNKSTSSADITSPTAMIRDRFNDIVMNSISGEIETSSFSNRTLDSTDLDNFFSVYSRSEEATKA